MFLAKSTLFDSAILNNVKILIVDNDQDSGTMYAALFEDYGVAVKTMTSIQKALDYLNQAVPDMVICETIFLGESVSPLIHRVRQIEQATHKVIPIFVTSTYPAIDLAKYLELNVEAYRIKPVDPQQFINLVWYLALLSKTAQPLRIQNYLVRLNRKNYVL